MSGFSGGKLQKETMKKVKKISFVFLTLLLSLTALSWGAYYWDYSSHYYSDYGFWAEARIYLEDGEVIEGTFIFDSSFLWVLDEEVGVAYQLNLGDISWFERHGRRGMTIATSQGEIIEAESTSSWKSGHSLFVYGIPEERDLDKGLKQVGLEMYVVNLDRKYNHPQGLKYIKRVELLSSEPDFGDVELHNFTEGEFKVE